MNINGYSSNIGQSHRKGQKNVHNFSQAAQDTSMKAVETPKSIANEGMEVFKKELHNEISQIYGKGSSAILSNSVQILKNL